jgi:hypothetical protein
MSAGPREQTTEAVRKHREELNEEGVCICGWHANVEMDYPDHLADVLWRALGLTEEWGFGEPDENEPDSWFSGDQQWPDPEAQAIQAANGRALFRRWASGWSVVDGEPSEGTLGVVDMDFCDCNRTLGGEQ